MTLHFYWTSLETQKGPNYWYQQSCFVWCLLRQRTGGLNSGLKSAIIVTDAFNIITNIKSFDFSTLYTTISHQKPKSRLTTIIRNSFLHNNGNRRYKYLVLGREGLCFVKEHSDSKNKYTEEVIIKMLEFLVDNIFVVFAGKVFQQIIGIPMGTNFAPLLADIFLYSYEAEFIQSLLSAGKKR